MPTAWLTYAWEDNDRQDVDFIAQELERSGVAIQLAGTSVQADVYGSKLRVERRAQRES